MSRKVIVFLFAAFILTATQGMAGEIVLDKVIVSARGTDSIQSLTPGGTGVVTEEEILLAPKPSIADALSRLAGVTQTGESPWGQDISIRGLTGSSIIILVDGVRINTATELNARLGFINPMDVERVEVLKGPISSLYGTGSIGGVVNIITKKGHYTEEKELHGELIGDWYSNPEGVDGYARANVSAKNFWFQGAAAGRDHDDVFGGGHTEVRNSQYEDVYFKGSGGIKWSELLETEFQFMRMNGHEIGIPGGTAKMPQTADISYPNPTNTLANIFTTLTPEGSALEKVSLNLYYTMNERRVRIDKPAPPVKEIKPEADHETWGAKLQSHFEFPDHQLIMGAEWWNWHMTSERNKYLVNGMVLTDKPTPTNTQSTVGIFGEDNWTLSDDFTLNLGARLDRVEVDNKETSTVGAGNNVDWGWNLHAGLTWQPSEAWSHTFIAATSYRVPDSLERFKYINLGGQEELGNPDLDTEKSYYLEYGLHYSTSTLSFSGSAYANFITDYIELERISPTELREENIGQANIYGIDLEADWHFATSWNLYGTVSLATGRDEENDEYLRYIAPVNGLTGIKYTMGNGLWSRLETQWALRQAQTPDDVEDTPGWLTLNAAIGYAFEWKKTQHEVALTVNNILDRKYVNYLANARGVDLLEPGINASINYKLTF